MFAKMKLVFIKWSRFWLALVFCLVLVTLTACGTTNSGTSLPSPTMTPTPTLEPVEPGPIPPQEQTTPPTDLPTEDPNLEPTATDTVVDVCSLVTAFDVENVLGQTITSITPGSEPDDISGGTLNYCTFVGSGQAVVISSVEVENASFGIDMLNAQVDAVKSEEPDTEVNQELGVGVKAYWSTSEHAGQYTVLTEEHVFAVALGGNIGNPEDHKAALLTLAQIVEKQQ